MRYPAIIFGAGWGMLFVQTALTMRTGPMYG